MLPVHNRQTRNEDAQMDHNIYAAANQPYSTRPATKHLVEIDVKVIGVNWQPPRAKTIELHGDADYEDLTELFTREVVFLTRPDYLEPLLMFKSHIGTDNARFEDAQPGMIYLTILARQSQFCSRRFAPD